MTFQHFVIKSYNYYNKAATTIQRHFKGYMSRKYCANVKQMKLWSENVLEENKKCCAAMDNYRLVLLRETEELSKQKIKAMIMKKNNTFLVESVKQKLNVIN